MAYFLLEISAPSTTRIHIDEDDLADFTETCTSMDEYLSAVREFIEGQLMNYVEFEVTPLENNDAQ